MANIHDVAALAGVSPATVSRVLNGNHPVSAATKKRVEQAIRDLDFQPNLVGRNLSKRVSNSILVAVSSFSSEMYQRTLQGMIRVAEQESFDLMTACIAENPYDPTSNNWENCARYIRGGMVGGLILLGVRSIEAARNAPEIPVPTVQCGETVSSHFQNSVTCDNRAAMRELTERLISQGYRRFSFITSRKPYETEPSDFSRDRLLGMQDALSAAHLPYIPELTLSTLNRVEIGRAHV